MFVPAAWVAWLRTGTPLSISIKETGQVYEARISKMNSRVDGVSQQLEVEALIEKGEGRLLPGTVGTAVFETPPHPLTRGRPPHPRPRCRRPSGALRPPARTPRAPSAP